MPFGRRGTLFAVAAAALVAVVGYVGWSATQEAKAIADQVAVASDERDRIRAEVQRTIAADQQLVSQEVRRGVVVQLAGARINWNRLVRDTVAVIPRNRVSLTKISGKAPEAPQGGNTTTPAAPTAEQPQTEAVPQGIRVEGIALTQPDVAQLVSRMEGIPGITGARVTQSERTLVGKRAVITFVVEASIDQRAQDRPTLTLASGDPAASSSTTAGVAP